LRVAHERHDIHHFDEIVDGNNAPLALPLLQRALLLIRNVVERDILQW
tara:strand:+ start:1502 stop:1645 length:144 start_codon:yes stop_codon:yes gene_type:complete